eukprot:m.15404 g.15404  ORF g.15404 m.15404 type:complete len:86 (-) comp5384_c0_seq1:442-699(-)
MNQPTTMNQPSLVALPCRKSLAERRGRSRPSLAPLEIVLSTAMLEGAMEEDLREENLTPSQADRMLQDGYIMNMKRENDIEDHED